MARGRRKNVDPTVEYKCRIPQTIVDMTEQRLSKLKPDPLNIAVPAYGMRSELVTKLLRKWLAGEINVDI